jgi:hypothetical protein
MMSWMCGVSLKKHLSNEVRRRNLCSDCASDVARRDVLRWFGDVERKTMRWTRSCIDLNEDDSEGVGLESPGLNKWVMT